MFFKTLRRHIRTHHCKLISTTIPCIFLVTKVSSSNMEYIAEQDVTPRLKSMSYCWKRSSSRMSKRPLVAFFCCSAIPFSLICSHPVCLCVWVFECVCVCLCVCVCVSVCVPMCVCVCVRKENNYLLISHRSQICFGQLVSYLLLLLLLWSCITFYAFFDYSNNSEHSFNW